MRHRNGSDEGISLVEVLVSLVISAIIGSLVLSAVVSSQHVLRRDDSAVTGQADVRKVVERLGADIRASRSVAPGADTHHLVLWIDSNSDYKQEPDEVVTWELIASTVRTGQYDLLRITSAGTVKIEATTVVSEVAFEYCDSADPSTCVPTNDTGTSLVHTTLTFNANLNLHVADRTVDFWARLRNVAGTGV